MTSRRKIRTLAVLVAVASLAACGTRLDHDTIAAAGGGTGTGIGGAGTGLPGGDIGTGLPGGDVATGPGGTGPAGTGASGTGPAGTGASGTGPAGTGTGTGAGGGGANGAPIVVGTVESYSGPSGVFNKDNRIALRAWAAVTNAGGGINGRPIKLITYDDGGDSGKARSLVQKLVEQDKAMAVLGTDSVGVNGFKSYLEKQRVPTFGSCGYVGFESPVFFSPCAHPDDGIYLLALHGAKHGKGNKLGVLSCVEAPDCRRATDTMFNKYARKAGLNPVYRADVSFAQPDFTSHCIEARNRGVELFSIFLDANSVRRVAESCRRQGYNPQFLQGMQISEADFPRTPGLENVLVLSGVFPYAGLSTPAAKEFYAVWEKYSGGEMISGNATKTWAAARIFETAAKKAGNSLSRDSLFKAVYGVSGQTYGGLTIPLTFKAGQGSRPARCSFGMRASGGKWISDSKPFCV